MPGAAEVVLPSSPRPYGEDSPPACLQPTKMPNVKNSKTSSKTEGPDKKHIPVLIIPGFMSSVLTVQSSSLKPSWKDKRLWLNITSLGFNSIKQGGKLQRNEIIRSKRILNAENTGTEETSDPTLEQLHAEYMKQVECKNRWVQHMQLGDDLITERKGVVVRPLEGTAAVDYLSEGALTESMSYVFGPVLKLLRSVGYEDGVNLNAAPYDWRIPPSALETRDKYFSKTVEKIERMYHYNKSTPVAILSHSMGCRASHYLFNFVIHSKGEDEGMEWLTKHIGCWIPVGAPHIGTPTSVRCMMDGDKMGLDQFLSDFEGLCLARSFGSPPWLFPIESHKHALQKPTMATAFIQHESVLHISIPRQRLNLELILKDMKIVYPARIRLAVRLGKKVTIRTNHFAVSEREPYIDFDNETWIVPCPTDIEGTAKMFPNIQICLEKPGAGLPKKHGRGVCDFDLLCPARCILCIIKWVLCFPCAFVGKFLGCLSYGAMKGVNAGASALGSNVVIADSELLSLGTALVVNSNQRSDVENGSDRSFNLSAILKPVESDDSLCRGIYYLLFWKHPQSETLSLNVKWEPMSMSQPTKPVPLYQKSRKYAPSDAQQLLSKEGMGRVTNLLQSTYVSDPIGPLSKSSWDAPPIKRVIAIYGINYPSEISAVYKRNPTKHIPNASNKKSESSELEPTFVLDKDAILDKTAAKTHTIKRGLIYETSKSPQEVITPDGRIAIETKSGDGSVPYWSLQHCRTWQGQGPAECEVAVHEIDSVEHRAILNDSRFHNILLNVLGLVA